MTPTPVVVAGKRTAIGIAGHGFADVPAPHLAVPVLKAVAAEIAPLGVPIDDVIREHILQLDLEAIPDNLTREAALRVKLAQFEDLAKQEKIPGFETSDMQEVTPRRRVHSRANGSLTRGARH